MFEFLEIKYLAIKWTDEDTVFKIEESNDILTIEEDVDHYDSGGTVQTVTFTNFHHYLGLHFEGDIEHPPYFELSNGNREYLISFTSPSNNKTWWIQNSGWDSKNKRYYSELYRTVGKVNLVIQNKKLLIENNDIEFTVAELEHYLSDFKNDLWLLILDNNNPVKANISKEVPNIFHEDILLLFKDFIDTSIDLIRNPNMFLSERQNSLPIKKVKPIPRTFRELLENPNRKHAISRDFYESYDTAENRYIYYCVDKVLYLLRRFDRLATSQVSIYQRKIAFEKRWKDDLISKDTKIIDKDVFEGEIKTIQTQLDILIRQLNGFKININPDNLSEFHNFKYHNFRVKLGKKLEQKNGYFIQELNDINRKDFQTIYGVSSIIFEIHDKDFMNIDLSNLKVVMSFAGFCNIDQRKTSKDPTKFYDNFNFKKITWVDFDDTEITQYIRLLNKINELKSRKVELENKKWILPLTPQEKKELLDEAKVIEGNIKLFEDVEDQIRTVSAHLPQYISKLKNVSDFFKRSKVKKNPNCPNSMVFIQNPIYASCKSLFKQVINLNGLDLSLFDAMIQVDEIGLVNIANLYEKWCLIQTIKVLKSVYGFVLEDDWQANLIHSVLKKKYNIAIKMSSKVTQQWIQLTYEKQLSNGKRPDIVVDLHFNRYESYYDDGSKQDRLKKIKTKTKRLVMDAKFQNLDQSSHDSLINQLYFPLDETDKSKPKEMRHKNYSEDNSNQVFIIHPKPSVIESPTSPLDWGRYCDYGQSNSVIHRYGGIFLSPSMKYPHTIDNLQRLIGMFIQESTERHQGQHKNWHNMACISCGNNDRTHLRLTHSTTQGGKDKWALKCLKCSHLTLQSICYNCKNIIFKNGLKWTYHRTRAEQFSNIVCPHCESFL